MKRLILVALAAGLSALVIAASGCSGGSDAEAQSPPPTTSEQVETQPPAESAVDTTTEQVETPAPAESAVDISKFQAAFTERFGPPGDEAPWYRSITAMKMGDTSSTVAITTTLDPEIDIPEGDPLAQVGPQAICHAAADVAVNNEAGDGIDRVVVFASEGVQLWQCGW